MRSRYLPLAIVVLTLFTACALRQVTGQSIAFKKEQAEAIVAEVAEAVQKQYYDPKLNGVDWDAQRREATRKIENASTSNQTFANIAAMLDSLNDSHTYFIPPPRSFSLDYGWRIEAIGERCFVTRVRPETDAETKVHPGDEILAINDYTPARANIHRIEYVLDTLRPQSKIQVTVRTITGEKAAVRNCPESFSGAAHFCDAQRNPARRRSYTQKCSAKTRSSRRGRAGGEGPFLPVRSGGHRQALWRSQEAPIGDPRFAG